LNSPVGEKKEFPAGFEPSSARAKSRRANRCAIAAAKLLANPFRRESISPARGAQVAGGVPRGPPCQGSFTLRRVKLIGHPLPAGRGVIAGQGTA
jgi:hypothetical protein